MRKRIMTVKVKVIATLLIFLGSHLNLIAAQSNGGPHFDIFRVYVDRSYDLTNQLSIYVEQNGYIQLKLSQYQFILTAKEKGSTVQHIPNLPDLHSSAWLKEWKSSDLPIFCKAEHLIQKKSGIAFRFRLGSLDYVNGLEGK